MMRDGARRGEVLEVRRAAHALRGSSAQIGAIVVAKACEQIELAAAEWICRRNSPPDR